MKIKDLIEILEGHDPETHVFIERHECGQLSPSEIVHNKKRRVTWRNGFFEYCSKTATKKVTEALILELE